MKCPCCDKDIIEREGKFGPFLCCPSGKHGTFSIQGNLLYFTGQIGQMLKNQRIQEVYDRLGLESISEGVAFQPSLSRLMNAQMAAWGWNSGEEMEQLADFAIGNPEDMWDDNERENGEHWWNVRPY